MAIDPVPEREAESDEGSLHVGSDAVRIIIASELPACLCWPGRRRGAPDRDHLIAEDPLLTLTFPAANERLHQQLFSR